MISAIGSDVATWHPPPPSYEMHGRTRPPGWVHSGSRLRRGIRRPLSRRGSAAIRAWAWRLTPACERLGGSRLLPRHRDAEALLRADQVVEVLGRLVDVDLHPVDAAGEPALPHGVVVAHGRGRVLAEVGRLVAGEDQRHGGRDRALADLLAVDVQPHGGALPEPAAGVVELHAHLVGPARHASAALDGEALQAEEVVAVLQPPALHVEHPAAERAALRDDHAVGPAAGGLDLGRDR